MASDPFADLVRDLPDGAFWVTGAWLKQFCAVLTADRVRAGSNIDEIPGDKGRTFNAKAGSGSTVAASTPPLTVVDASADAHPGRVRVYKGRLGGLLPAEMHLVDALLPGGTDNRCYLQMAPGFNFIYGKVLVDADNALFTSAHVYTTPTEEEPDGTFAYLLIAQVYLDGTTMTFEQLATGNQKLKVYSTPDGTLLIPDWAQQT